MAALAPWNRDQSSTAPSRTGVVSTASMPGFDARCGNVAGGAYAWQRRHVGDLFREIGKIHFDRAMLADLHEALMAVLVIDGARHPDRLVRRAEMRVAADLHRDLAAQGGRG
jgi:hypothetical protein